MSEESWQKQYHHYRIQDQSKALSMLNDVYSSLPPSAERIYTAARIHGFVTRRGDIYSHQTNNYSTDLYENIEHLILKSMDLEDEGQYEKSLHYIKTAKNKSKSLNNLDLNSFIQLKQCRANLALGNHYMAEFYCQSALKHLEKKPDHYIDIKWGYRLLALSYQGVTNYQSALIASEKALSLTKPYEINDTAYNNISTLLLSMGKINSAKEYAIKALDIRTERKIPQKIAQSHLILARIYLQSSNYAQAKVSATLAIEHLQNSHNAKSLSQAYLTFGCVLNAQGYYDDGIEYLLLALKQLDLNSNSDLNIEIYQALSQVYLKNENVNKALNYITIAVEKSEKSQNQQALSSSYLIQSQIHEFIGNFELALSSRKQYEGIIDKIHSIDNQEAYTTLQLRKSLIEQKEEQLNNLKTMHQKQLEINIEKKYRLLFQIIIVLLSITIYFILRSRKRLNTLAHKDVLTNANNRHSIFEIINETLTNFHDQTALVMLDIDNFKQLNDLHGHPNGDLGLKHLYSILEKAMPPPHQIGRIGGEEFLILLSNETKNACFEMIESARSTLEKSSFTTLDGKNLSITASFSWVYLEREMKDVEQIYFILDEGLYQAKQNGKNCIVDALVDEIT
ncbi:GGDEF domain-containing protein [Aliivibrio sp. 1S128]|uniref:tetratricopeptide repeat-containing diguanylate cyclase n=1 Tax=Aliivibrio sp. 1S128 TaxID=1840085 RepID=UPI00080DA0DE|nr:GGDEF domain-containing protein [Aliivibrio sp. 1S128]OCH24160.1 hypothetical protein A6E03_06815 [Aliivibrio sp. 1S128]